MKLSPLLLCICALIIGTESRIEKKPPIELRKYPLRKFINCVNSCHDNHDYPGECYLVPVTETKLVASKCVVKCYFGIEAAYENLETCLCWQNRCVAQPLKRKMPDEEQKPEQPAEPEPEPDQPDQPVIPRPDYFRLRKKTERRLHL